MKTKTIAKEPPKLVPIKPSEVSAVLLLPEQDPTVALYEGIALFETEQHQQALEKLVFAAEHFHLHAIPYLEALSKRKDNVLIIDAETQQKLLAISAWSA